MNLFKYLLLFNLFVCYTCFLNDKLLIDNSINFFSFAENKYIPFNNDIIFNKITYPSYIFNNTIDKYDFFGINYNILNYNEPNYLLFYV